MDRMGKFSKAESRKMYSWWWDSHISPKNSKWLQENLTDMDSKVKLMIKLIEEDADSFARRAEMYYKKRPELMKLVEEFYRAYRALAERYDNATGVIRHAHRTMAEAFPNQVQTMFGDDSPLTSNDSSNLNGEFTDDSDTVARRKVFAGFKDEFMSVDNARRSLNFDEIEEKEEKTYSNGNKLVKDHDSEEIMALKEAIVKLETEKEAGLSQYQQSLDKLTQLEAEIEKMKDEFKVLSDHGKKAESELIILSKKLSEVEAEKKCNLQNYQQSVEKITKLQEDARKLDERVDSAESEAQYLKSELDKIESEKDVALDLYMKSLDTISNLENKLHLVEEDSKMFKERAGKAESEIEVLRETVTNLTREKENAVQKYQQCLVTISELEEKLKIAQDEAKQLSFEIANREVKLKGAEEQFSLLEKSNQSLHMEFEGLMLKMGIQSHELGKLCACIQEEKLRFSEAETAFQTLQHLHAKSQEELRVMASDLQRRAVILKDTETEKQSLQDEVMEFKKLNASFELSIKDMKNEISSLVESKGKLENEVELRLDQRNALQQEIDYLKENINDLNKKHSRVLDQVLAVGLNAESFESSVKDLQNDNTRLHEACQNEITEKSALLLKLAILEQLMEKNSHLETSLYDLNADLEASREKIENLEHSLRSLFHEKSTILDEKDTLSVEFEDTKRDFEKLSQDNTVLENSLSDLQHQHEVLMSKSKILEDSFQLLVNEKTGLKTDNDRLTFQLETVVGKLENLGKFYTEVEKRCFTLEKEKELNLSKVEELQLYLDVEKQEHSNYVRICETQFTGFKTEIDHLREECERKEGELDQVMDRTINNDLKILVLRIASQELKERNHSLCTENLELIDKTLQLGSKISELEGFFFQQNEEIEALVDQNRGLRAGNFRLLKALDVSNGKGEKDHVYFNLMLSRIQNMKESMNAGYEEKIEAYVQIFVLIAWIRQLIYMNEELRSELKEEEACKEAQLRKIKDLGSKLNDAQASFEALRREKAELCAEKVSLTNKLQRSKEKNNALEEENAALFIKAFDLENISFVLKMFADEGICMMQEVMTDRTNLRNEKTSLLGNLSLAEGSLEEAKSEIIHHKEKLQKMNNEAEDFSLLKNQLNDEIESGKKMLQQMVLELKSAEEKLILAEKDKFESNKQVEDLSLLYDEVKTKRNEKENQILKLSVDNCNLWNENDALRKAGRSLEVELHNKSEEINVLESGASTLLNQLHHVMVSELLYEQKCNELHEACLVYMDQNENLETELAVFAPEIDSLKELVLSLEDHTKIHMKLQDPENEKLEGDDAANDPDEILLKENRNDMPQSALFDDLHDIRARLQMAVNTVVTVNDRMVQESGDLNSQLDASKKQLEILQNEVENMKSKSEITEAAGDALLTKDIVLDQVSNGSSHRYSNRKMLDENQVLKLWETSDPDPSFRIPRKVASSPIRMEKVVATESFTEEELKLHMLETSKKSPDSVQEVYKGKILQRLDSDVQKLVTLQTTIQELKRKLDLTEKRKRGKAVIMCEAIKRQLEEADIATLKLFDVNDSLMKNIDNKSSFDIKSFASFDFDVEDGGGRRRKLSLQACRMSEKIGRLQLEIQSLQLELLKLIDDENGRKTRFSIRRRILLKDYLYGRSGRTGKKASFCACLQPSTNED